MLRAHVIRSEGYRYYLEDLVPGRAEGSLVAGEPPGHWSGGGTGALGLAGRVGAPEFRDVLEGRHPRSGAPLRHRHGDRTVDGYDLTFGAPKSVSLLHLLAPGEMATEVGAGYRAAVDEAVDYLGRAAVGVRRARRGEVRQLPSTGPVAGAFVHRTSRALDPHLHTHVVVANVAQGLDGGWSALDSRRLFVHIPAAQGIYHARLRLELADRMGAAWVVPPSGLGDVAGVDVRLRRLFSTRTASIDQYRYERSAGTTRGRSTGAFHATRPDKDRTRPVESLVAEWRQRAVDFGYDLGDLTQVVGRGRRARTAPEDFEVGRIQDRLASLARDGRTVRGRDVVAAVANSATRGATAGTIESVAARITRSLDGADLTTGRFASLVAGDVAVAVPGERRPEKALDHTIVERGHAPDRSITLSGRDGDRALGR